MVFSLLFFAFVDLDVSWSIRFFLVFAALVADYLICSNGSYLIGMTRIKAAYLIHAAVIIVFFLVFDSRKDVEMISYMAILLLCLIVVFFSRTDERGIFGILRLFLFAGVLLAVYIIFVRLFPEVYLQKIIPRLPDSIRDYNEELLNTGYGVAVGGSIVYSDYVMILGFLALLVSLLFRSAHRILRFRGARLAAVMIMLLFALAVFIEGRRGELLCLAAASVLVFLFSFRKKRKRENRRKRWIFVLVILIIVIALAVLIVVGSRSRFLDTFRMIIDSLSSDGNGDITTGRINRWKRALELFRTSPVFGIGWGRYANNYRRGKFISDVVSLKINYKYAHNDILNVLCEMGIVGFVLTAVPLIYIFVRSFRQNRRLIRRWKEIPVEVLMLNLLSLGIQLFWALLGLIDPVFYKQFFLCYYAFAVIVQETALRREGESLRMADAAQEKEESIHGPVF